MLELIVTWSAGLLAWANILIWGTVFVLVALKFLIAAVLGVYGFVRGVRS